MAVVRICVCPCGHFGVQDVDDAPACRVCGTDDVDWMNVDADNLESDLDEAVNALPGLVASAPPESARAG